MHILGEAMFDKLQFQASTSVGGHAYFRVITRLVSKSAEGVRVIASLISPRMIVRAQNPGKYFTICAYVSTNEFLGRYTTPKQINSIPNTAVHAHFTTPSIPQPNPPHSLLPPSIGMNASLSGLTSSMVVSPPHAVSTMAPSVGLTTSGMHSASSPHKAMGIAPSMGPIVPAYGMMPPHMFSSVFSDQVNMNSNNNNGNNSPPKTPWLMSREVVYHHGKVGINTNSPPEALSVQGNILVTGDILKPSDRRLKRNFISVDTSAQLAAIEKLKIYDYEVLHDANGTRRERGGMRHNQLRFVTNKLHSYRTGT